MFRRQLTFIFLASSFVVFSCGKTEQKVDVKKTDSKENDSLKNGKSKNGKLSIVSDPNCKKSSCPVADFSLVDGSGNSIESTPFSGTVGVELKLNVKVSTKSPAGRILLTVSTKPDWLEVTSASEPGGKALSGTPTEFTSSNSITIIARDLTRCDVSEKGKKDPADCSDANQTLSDYDKVIKWSYSIADANGQGGYGQQQQANGYNQQQPYGNQQGMTQNCYGTNPKAGGAIISQLPVIGQFMPGNNQPQFPCN